MADLAIYIEGSNSVNACKAKLLTEGINVV